MESDPEAAAANDSKIKTLEDLFRPPLDLIFIGNMDAAKTEGCRTNKWLLVNVQNSEEFSCQILNRDVWKNPAVKAIVKEHFIFWQVYNGTRDGVRYMQFYPITTFPYIAILDPITGELINSWSNIQDPDMFCEKITDFLNHQPTPSGDSLADEGSNNSILNHATASSATASSATCSSMVNNNHSNNVSVSNSFSKFAEMTEDEQMAAAIAASLEQQDDKRNGVQEEEDEEIETFSDSDDEAVGSSSANANANANGKIALEEKEDYTKYLGCDGQSAELMFRFPDGNREKCCFPQDSLLKVCIL